MLLNSPLSCQGFLLDQSSTTRRFNRPVSWLTSAGCRMAVLRHTHRVSCLGCDLTVVAKRSQAHLATTPDARLVILAAEY
jgi:hypothetical protein